MSIAPALAGFLNFQQFILWAAVPKEGGKTDKLPCDPLGNPSNAHNPSNWLSYEDATSRAATLGAPYGVGFVFTDRDPFFFIDVDNCWGAEGWNETARWLLAQFPGCCVEVSQSGRGLHIFGTAHPMPAHKCKGPGFDLYTDNRFAALTETNTVGDARTNATPSINALVASYLLPGAHVTGEGWTDGPCEGWNGPTDDADLIQRALKSGSARAAFGDGVTFSQLWNADADALGRRWPDDHGARAYDASAADAALLSHLAFWTGRDCARMDRLFRESGLMREKWEEREDYRERTILGVVARGGDVYSKREPAPPPAVQAAAQQAGPPAASNGAGHLLAAHAQGDYFKGCVYVRGLHRVYVPDGALLRREQFKATYGGKLFALDADFVKTTRDAWEALTESLANSHTWTEGICFRPEEPPSSIVVDSGRRLLNTYVPAKVACTEGNVGPFWDLVTRLLPVDTDRGILLAYMAALVQYPGVKFQWSPLLQGVEGNGKSAIIQVLAEAVGWEYTHLPNAQDLGNKFNSWLAGKIFIGIEEIKVADRWEIMESLKPLITNPKIEVQRKGVDQTVEDNRANFVMCSNHRDAILKGRGDRRYCVFYTAQQEPGDLARDGMSGNYFPALYRWLRSGGFAHVTHWLRNYPIPPELNPAGACHRAPETSSTRDALKASLGTVEQEILAAIDEQRPGFRGGWVSSMAVDKLIKEMKNRGVSRNKRKGVLAAIGYEHHPALNAGRAPKSTGADGGRPRLYVERDGALWDPNADPNALLAAYEAAQLGG